MTRSQLITKVANDTNMTSAEVEKVMAVSYTHLTLPTTSRV